jgi:teichuronic acid biosynthesis glycosyltransferase TuaC
MKVLIIHSGRSNSISPFVSDQCLWLEKNNIKYELFSIAGKGLLGYLKAIIRLRGYLYRSDKRFDLIHAHYGLSGLVATFQSKLPVVVTYHGSDIHQKKVFKFSKIAIKRANHNIFVSEKLKRLANHPKNSSVVPCGVDFSIFKKMDKKEVRKDLELNLDKNYILFSSNFKRAIKNPEIAKEAVGLVENTELIELKSYTREQVAQLMNAVDICLLTSKEEGSPQFIKEAAASGQWIITTDVGDIREILLNYRKVKYVNLQVKEIKNAIEEVLLKNKVIQGENFNLSNYNNEVIVGKLISIYKTVLNNS